MRSSILLVSLAACAHSAASPLANSGGGATPTASVPFSADLDHLSQMAAAKDPSAWVSRTSLVGWTADHRVAYRVLVCDPDELGGRGAWCQLDLCIAKPGGTEADCTEGASFEAVDPSGFDRAATTTAHDAWLAQLGPVAAGTQVSDGATVAEVTGHGLFVTVLPGGTREQIIAPRDDDPELGVTGIDGHTDTASPDGACRAIVGMASRQGEYEGVHGRVPQAFAAVRCK